jgi:hypothetical protein
MKPEIHQILESRAGEELKLALIEIIEEILVQDNARKKVGQDKILAIINNQVATEEANLDACNIKYADIPDIFQFEENSKSTAMPKTDMYGQSVWPAAESKPSDELTRAEEFLDAALINGNERQDALAGFHHGDITSEGFEEIYDQPTATSLQSVGKNENFEQKSLYPEQAAIDKSGNKLISSKGNIIGSNFKILLTPDQERILIPILTRIFDEEFRKGNYLFKQAARHVLGLVREKFGSYVANKISIEHLQIAYIDKSAHYKDQGANKACDVLTIKNKSELEEGNVVNERNSTYFERDNPIANAEYSKGEGCIQGKQHRISEIRRRLGISIPEKIDGTRDNDGLSIIDAIAVMRSRFITADCVIETYGQQIDTSAQSAEKTTENKCEVKANTHEQAIIQPFSNNKLITFDIIAATRSRITSKLGTLNSELEYELLIDGATISVAYIEAGMRSYSAYASAMINDFGNRIKPYLHDFYEGACYYLGLDIKGMTAAGEIDATEDKEMCSAIQ